MKMTDWNRRADFDQYASHYDHTMNKALAVSGEDRDYFAAMRIKWLSRCLNQLRGERGDAVGQMAAAMDFGCGPGFSARYLFDELGVKSYVGVDTSADSIEVARKGQDFAGARFLELRSYSPAGDLDLAYCNGVLHHIPLGERRAAVDYVYRSLRPGGLFALWENNPLNLGTQYVMSRIPFDRGTAKLTAGSARRLVESCGFRVLSTAYLFVFPRALAPLRRLEPYLCSLPLGAQYQVLGRKEA